MAGFTKADIAPHIGTLTTFLNKAAENAKCDPDCQKEKERERIKTEFINAKNNLQNAPIRLEKAEKDWIIFDKGEKYYSEHQEQKYKKEGKEIIDKFKLQYIKPVMDKIDNQLQYYRSQYVYRNNVDSVHDSYSDNLKKLKVKNQVTQDKKNINDRLTYFYNNNSDVTKWFMYYPKIFYWIFVGTIVCIMIYKKTYKKFEYWPFLLLIFLGPFLMPKIYTLMMNNSKHFVIDNIYFIIVILIILLAVTFNTLSKLPFAYSDAAKK